MEVTTSQENGVRIVTVTGDLDVSTAPRLEAELTDGGPILADLCGVSFIDSYGLRTLLEKQRSSKEEGSSFAIACPEDSALQRLLELVGTVGIFSIHPSREEGLQALSGA